MEQNGPIVLPSKYCLGCWYALDGLSEPRCPECGRRFDPDNSDTFSKFPKVPMRRTIVRILQLMTVLVLLELPCSWISYEADSAIAAVFILIFVIPIGNLVAFSTLAGGRPRVTKISLFVVAILLWAFHVPKAILLIQTRYEAGRIISYMQGEFSKNEDYPTNLSNYQFAFSSNVQRFLLTSGSPSSGGYQLWWHVANPNASHWYTPVGGFGYYPD